MMSFKVYHGRLEVQQFEDKHLPKSDDIWKQIPGVCGGYAVVTNLKVLGWVTGVGALRAEFDPAVSAAVKYLNEDSDIMKENRVYIYRANGKDSFNGHTNWYLSAVVVKEEE